MPKIPWKCLKTRGNGCPFTPFWAPLYLTGSIVNAPEERLSRQVRFIKTLPFVVSAVGIVWMKHLDEAHHTGEMLPRQTRGRHAEWQAELSTPRAQSSVRAALHLKCISTISCPDLWLGHETDPWKQICPWNQEIMCCSHKDFIREEAGRTWFMLLWFLPSKKGEKSPTNANFWLLFYRQLCVDASVLVA